MKKLLLLLFFLAGCAAAQVSAPQILYITTNPTGTFCGATNIALRTPNGVLYTCQSGSYAQIGTGGSGTGCIPSGSATQILVDDGAGSCTSTAPTVSGTTITASITGHSSLDLPLSGGTLTGNLLFSTDNTRDIGANGATRPRDFYLGRNALIAGTLGVTGAITGSLTGNADTATALAANPTDCAANKFANAIAANGNLTCADPFSLTTTGSSGAATFSGGTLNIPQYSGGGGTGCTTSGTGVQTGDGAGGCTNNSGVTIASNTVSATGGFASGASPPSVTAGTGGVVGCAEGTVPTVGPASAVDVWYCDSTQHGILANFNNVGYKPLVQGPTSATSGHLATFSGTNGGLLADGGAVPTGTVTSAVIAGTANQITVTGTCTITTTGTCTLSIPAGVILGTDNSTAGTVQLANSAANAHTIWASGATTTNTIAGFATAPTTGHVVDCTVSSTTCTLHDSGLVTANVVQKIASGTASLGTTTVNTGTCSSAIDGGTATGVATTDTIIATANADPVAITGYTPATTGTLYVWAYPTTDHVNFKLCNNTGTNITPGSAVTLNWRVVR